MPLLGRSPEDSDQLAIRETQDKEKDRNNKAEYDWKQNLK